MISSLTGKSGGSRSHDERKRRSKTDLGAIPEDVTFQDIQYHIYVRQQIARGLEDIDQGRVVSEDEAERWISKWLEPSSNEQRSGFGR
jgi:predicted transcriptional regulator